MLIRTLSWDECADVLSTNQTARLACSKLSEPYVVPITYAFSGNCLYSFSVLGQKIEWMRGNPLVCVEVYEPAHDQEWKTVVANGKYDEFSDEPYYYEENDFSWKLLRKRANWWEPGSLKPENTMETQPPKYIFYRVRVESMTGRHAVDEDPSDHDGRVRADD